MLIDTNATIDEQNWATEVVNNWRAAHQYPLNTFQANLRRYARKGFKGMLVAERTKRRISIEQKLRWLDWLKLSRMQDIGGCRAVLKSVAMAKTLFSRYVHSKMIHELEKIDNYVLTPKKSGYRSIHLIYRYRNNVESAYNSLRIELQIRSQLQHVFATTVEVVDLMTSQKLKSNRGTKKWERFFALMGNVFARQERGPLIPETPENVNEVREELRELENELKVTRILGGCQSALVKQPEWVTDGKPYYYLLKLDIENRKLHYVEFKKNELELANQILARAEAEKPSKFADVVLVSVDSISSLRRAYPNYLGDTIRFMELIGSELKT